MRVRAAARAAGGVAARDEAERYEVTSAPTTATRTVTWTPRIQRN